jgi:hypothetical protein
VAYGAVVWVAQVLTSDGSAGWWSGAPATVFLTRDYTGSLENVARVAAVRGSIAVANVGEANSPMAWLRRRIAVYNCRKQRE